ncbi:MAG: hypothetical protein E6J47_07770 [Chloroflexi bacterium]|nr:MAG: hypothetical protein E6J47_07770 [Chloroflexota bacterium]
MAWGLAAARPQGTDAQPPASDFARLPAKLPLTDGQRLRIAESGEAVTVSGETFAYHFSKRNGLIDRVEVLGDALTDGPIPDLTLAENIDRTVSPYAARHERAGQLSVLSADPARARLAATGQLTSLDDRRFPLRYAITYDVFIDGVVGVAVEYTSLEDCWFRWLSLSGGALKAAPLKFLSWAPEQSTAQENGQQFKALGEEAPGKLVAGVFIPWFWLGNERTGLEVTTWDVSSQTWNHVDGSSRKDQSDMFVLERRDGRIEWEDFLRRNVGTFARKGWRSGGQFALGVTPSKRFDPYYAMLKGYHLGPHQHRPDFAAPSEEQIRLLAQSGYDLLTGIANWRSGEYVPLNEEDVRRTITLCHRYGIKVIPYVTLMDLGQGTDAFREHGADWAIEPTTEFYRSSSTFRDPAVERAWRNDPDPQTMLMCPNAEGWRAHWEKQIDRIVDQYDFDGIYVDFWSARLVCENARHGCGGRFRRYTVPGARAMLVHAYNRLKAKDPRAIIKVNTNTLSTSLLTSLMDLRLVGENTDAASLDPISRRWVFSSHHLGATTELLFRRTMLPPEQQPGFGAVVNFLPQVFARPPIEGRKTYDDFDVFRAFGAEQGEWRLGIAEPSLVAVDSPGVFVNVIQRPDRWLATFINPGASPVTARPSLGKAGPGSLVYDPLAERIVCDPKGAAGPKVLEVELPSGGSRTLQFQERPTHPTLLSALGGRREARQEWDGRARRLRLSVSAAPGTPVRYTLYSEAPVKAVTNDRGQAVAFTWSPETRLAHVSVAHEEGDRIDVSF